MQVTFGVLGPLQAVIDGRPARLGGQRPRSVLAVLLLRAGQVVPVPVLVDAVWGDVPPVSAANLLQGYVSGLRKELGRECIETTGPGYRLTVPPDAFDLRRFERLAADGSRTLTQRKPADALEKLTAALALWRGPALADVSPDGIIGACAARLEDLRLAVHEQHAEALLALGAAREAVTELAPIVDDHPLREEPRGLLMLALYRCGRQADALDVFRRGREAMINELGIEPGAALRELEGAILRQDAGLDGVTTAAGGGGRSPAEPASVGKTSGVSNGGRTTGTVIAGERQRSRTVLVGALDPAAIPRLVSIAEPLIRGHDRGELIIAMTVAEVAGLAAAVGTLNRQRDTLIDRGVTTRTAAFTSVTPGLDLGRLAAEQDVELMLVDAPRGLLEDARLTALLESAPCDVAVLVAGEERRGPVLVTFAGADHDWAAVELGAWFSQRTGSRLVLVGALSGDHGRDASRLLANASLAVQRALGVAAEPLLVDPDPAAFVAATADAGLVLVGLTERWRREGMGRVRTALATAGGHPTLLVRRGLRPGGLAPRDPGTRFTFTVAGIR